MVEDQASMIVHQRIDIHSLTNPQNPAVRLSTLKQHFYPIAGKFRKGRNKVIEGEEIPTIGAKGP